MANKMTKTEQGRATRAAETAARAAAGLNLADNNPLSGRGDSFYQFSTDLPGTDEPLDQGVHDQTNDVLPVSQSAFAAIICVNGKPHYASIQGEIGDEIT